LTAVPSHAEVIEIMGGRLKAGELQSHHTVPKYVQELFGITNETVQDSVPSLVLKQVDHTGKGAGSFHNILYKYIPKGTKAGQLNNGQLLAALKQAYTEFKRPDVWEVAEVWLRSHGIH
jgi:hypothetical protein